MSSSSVSVFSRAKNLILQFYAVTLAPVEVTVVVLFGFIQASVILNIYLGISSGMGWLQAALYFLVVIVILHRN
jgi:hypothetical protein